MYNIQSQGYVTIFKLYSRYVWTHVGRGFQATFTQRHTVLPCLWPRHSCPQLFFFFQKKNISMGVRLVNVHVTLQHRNHLLHL